MTGVWNALERKEKSRQLEKANLEIKENKDRLQLLLNSTAEGIYGIDKSGNCTFVNDSALKMLGYNENEVVGKNMHDLIHYMDKSGNAISLEECKIVKALRLGKGTNVDDEVFWRKDNSYFSVEYYSYPQKNNGEIVGAVITFVDNTERKRMQQQIYSEKEQFRTTLLSVGDGVIATDNRGRVKMLNPVAEELTGWKLDEAMGKPFEQVFNIINEYTREQCENPVERVLEDLEIIELANHTILISKNGTEIPIEDSAAPIKSKDGVVTGVVVVFRDFSEKKEKIDRIEYLSLHDHLTGLYNRRYMEDSIERLDTERNLPFTIMVLDVNGLKLTNDAFGHKMGDKLLISVADMLKTVCRKDDIVGRMGGDEFMILLPKTSSNQAEKIKDRILKAANNIKLGSVIISLAVGYATKINEEKDIKVIVTTADNNMYKDKLKYGKIMRSKTIETVLKNINNKYDREQIHTERVSQYCEAIAKEMNFGEKGVEDIKTAGILHDIGKIMIPPEILNKPSKLTEEEFEVVKRHPETSYQILKSVDEYAVFATDVLYHHERIDGKGYPEGLKGDEIPLNARIIAVADAYEAMTADRPYQSAMTKEEAIEELRKNAGTQFDKEVVSVFIEKVLK
jgi:diguanylate cyclase (GGDEF)-like protein/PAS domain S-box-containing protein